MDLPHIRSVSPSAESDMEVFEDVRERTADEMEYEDTVKRNLVNHGGKYQLYLPYLIHNSDFSQSVLPLCLTSHHP